MSKPAELTAEAVRTAVAYAAEWVPFRRRITRVPGIQVAVWFDDGLAMSEAYGVADVDTGAELTTSHLFRVASHSKTFTATAIMQLVEAGTLRLDDRVDAWLPFVADDPDGLGDVTVRELLSHAGGVIRDGNNGDFWQRLRPFLDEDGLRAASLDGAHVLDPNQRFKYSNIGYSLLGLVVAAASGAPYNEYVTTSIVERLGLTDTGPEMDGSRAEEYAAGHSSLAYDDERRTIPHVDTRAMSAATGFYSTAADLCRYASAHFLGDERLLTDRSKRQMQHEHWDVSGGAGGREGHYGLGFAIGTVGERRMIGHGGGYPGHITRTMFDPEARLAVSALTNTIDGPAEEIASGIVKLVDLAAAPPAGDPVSAEEAAPFCGRFASLWNVVDVVHLGGRLLLISPSVGDPAAMVGELSIVDEDTLRVEDINGYASVGEPMRFERDANGAIEQVRGTSAVSMWPYETYRLMRAEA
ncbi:MAG: serine hydrolase domain-containing protein [Actinomycetota bacterium]|nr:serine hydrolase domain-containing protein [Actinomycetota bacterium]